MIKLYETTRDFRNTNGVIDTIHEHAFTFTRVDEVRNFVTHYGIKFADGFTYVRIQEFNTQLDCILEFEINGETKYVIIPKDNLTFCELIAVRSPNLSFLSLLPKNIK